VTEYMEGDAQCAKEPPVAEQVVVFSGEAKSSAFNQFTRLVRLHSDAICSVKFGKNPTATTDSRRMSAGVTEYFAVESGFKVSAIANT